jgi:hypothetical protein
VLQPYVHMRPPPPLVRWSIYARRSSKFPSAYLPFGRAPHATRHALRRATMCTCRVRVVHAIRRTIRKAPTSRTAISSTGRCTSVYRDGSMGRSRLERDRQLLVWADSAAHRAAGQEEAQQAPRHQPVTANARAPVLLPHTSRATEKDRVAVASRVNNRLDLSICEYATTVLPMLAESKVGDPAQIGSRSMAVPSRLHKPLNTDRIRPPTSF